MKNNRIIIKLLALHFLFGLPSCSDRSNKSEEVQINSQCDKIMKYYCEGNINKTIDLLGVNSVIKRQTLDSFSKSFENQRINFLREFGAVIDCNFIRKLKAGKYLMARFYLLRFKYSFVKFYFLLYFNNEKWTIAKFENSFDTSDLFDK
jgi:hypothetical protein